MRVGRRGQGVEAARAARESDGGLRDAEGPWWESGLPPQREVIVYNQPGNAADTSPADLELDASPDWLLALHWG